MQYSRKKTRMKKRILSVLCCGSLLFGTIGVNAVSIEFDDIQEDSIYVEALETIDATEETQLTENEIIQPALNEDIVDLTSLIATESDIMLASANDGTLEYVKTVTGYAYTAFVKECNSRFWSTSKGYDSSYNDRINRVNAKDKKPFGVTQANATYVPLIENIYLTRGSVIEISVFGSSCNHQPSKATLYISQPHQSPIQYASSNQNIFIGTLNIPYQNGSSTGSQIFRYVVHSNGYYTLDALGEAYGCTMSIGHGIYITDSYKIYRYKYNISYNLDGGTLDVVNPTYYYEDSSGFTLNNPVKTGYSFMGWNGTELSNTTKNVVIPSGSYGNRNYTAKWKANQYSVTYIDVIDSINGKVLGKTTSLVDYDSTVRGSDKGSNTADNAYYNGYYYDSDTSATVTTSGATVYRIFKQRMNTIAGNIIWEDWNNKNLSRPENVNLYINGSDGSKSSYVITGNNSQNTADNKWPYSYELPKYDSNGNVIVYTVSQDRAISQEKGLSYQEPLINGYDITNKITNRIINTEDYFQIPVTITWDDENDSCGFRPETATIQLLRNGEVIKTADVSDSYTFTELLKYNENGDKYVYTIQASDEKRYTKIENNSAPYNKTVIYTFVESSFSVLIPKVIVLDGIGGNANYDITVNGAFYYNDTLTVKPATSFVMTDRSNISQMKANILQSKQNFMKEDIASSGAKAEGSIQVDRTNFAGLWAGTFNFDIKFVMQN